MSDNILCQATGLDGSPCTRHRTHDRETCWWHSPEKIEERARKLEEQANQLRASVTV